MTTTAADLDALTIDQAQTIAAANGWTIYAVRGTGTSLQQTFGRDDNGITVFYRDGRTRPLSYGFHVNSSSKKLIRDLRSALTA